MAGAVVKKGKKGGGGGGAGAATTTWATPGAAKLKIPRKDKNCRRRSTCLPDKVGSHHVYGQAKASPVDVRGVVVLSPL